MKNFNKKTSFKHFGLTQNNERWSWSAISADEKIVGVTLWKDQIKYDDNGNPEWNTFGLPIDQNNELWKNQIGNRERIKHLKYSLENLEGLFRVVITVAKNENAYQYLTDSIQSFYYNPELKNIFNKNGFFCYTEKKYLGGIAILNVFSKV